MCSDLESSPCCSQVFPADGCKYLDLRKQSQQIVRSNELYWLGGTMLFYPWNIFFGQYTVSWFIQLESRFNYSMSIRREALFRSELE